jgi:hypothetical protein
MTTVLRKKIQQAFSYRLNRSGLGTGFQLRDAPVLSERPGFRPFQFKTLIPQSLLKL